MRIASNTNAPQPPPVFSPVQSPSIFQRLASQAFSFISTTLEAPFKRLRLMCPTKTQMKAFIEAVKNDVYFRPHLDENMSRLLNSEEITDSEEKYVETIKFLTSKSGAAVCSHFSQSGITDIPTILEIIDTAHNNGWSVADDIEEFGITDPDQLFELAKLDAKRYGMIGFHLDEFKITDPEKKYEIAKLVATVHGYYVAEAIHNYDITNPERLFELAILSAKSYPGDGISLLINRFGITNQKHLFEIAKVAVELNGFSTLYRIDRYNLSDPDYILEIKRLCYIQLLNSSDYSYIRNYATYNQLDNLFQSSKNADELKKQVDQWSNNEFKYSAKVKLLTFLCLCDFYPQVDEFLKLHPKLLLTIFEERDIAVYGILLTSVLNAQSTKSIANTLEKQLVMLPMHCTDIENKEAICNKLLQCDVRDMQRRRPLLQLFSILKTQQLSPSQWNKILSWVLEDPKNKDLILHRYFIIMAFSNLEIQWDIHMSFETILTQAFCSKFPDLKLNQPIETLLTNTFLKSRNPVAIFLYSSRLLKLSGKESQLENLTLFIQSIFDGNFLQVRRNLEKNIHLKYLTEHHPLTLEQFHQFYRKKIELSNTQDAEPHHITLRNMITHSVNDNHLPNENFDRLLFVLNNPVKLKEYIDALVSEIKEKSREKAQYNKVNPELFLKLNNEVSNLKLQLSLLRLMDENVTEGNYNECVSAFSHVKKSEFLNDLKAMKNVFHKNDSIKNCFVESTDNPYDILLCGTEVEGSCQRIDGNPKLNQGVLGYLLNGQTRLLTLKEEGNDVIKGRAILRLLIDEQKQPVLFLERVYPAMLNPQLKQALLETAKEIAETLKVNLACGDDWKKGNHTSILSNFGVQAKEYVDSAGGLQSNYQITKAYKG